MNTPMPDIRIASSTQNAWVQDWLAAYFREHARGDDLDAYEHIIECIQETYSHAEHQAGR